jgi:uncharacterized protein (TIGR03084 family)
MAGMRDAVAAYVDESRALEAFLADLTDAQWRHPSGCAGWTVADVVLHLAQSEESVVAAVDDGDSGRPFAPYLARARAAGGGAVDALMAAAVEAERPADPRSAFERWRTANRGATARLAQADPSARVPWVAVPLAVRTLAATRLSEHWIHSLDIREPLGDPVADTDRLWHVARLAWRTLPYAFAEVGESVPDVRLVLTGPSGDEWFFGDDAPVTVTGPAGQWCRVAARRLRPADTTLDARGPGASRVLQLVRTYA